MKNPLPGQTDHDGDYDNIPGDLDNGLTFFFVVFIFERFFHLLCNNNTLLHEISES